MKRSIFFIVIVAFFAIHISTIHAQLDSSVSGNLNDVTISVNPDTPVANQEVTLTVKSYLISLDSADISWSIDGKRAQSGVGLETFKFTTKDVGQSTTIDVTVLPVGGYVIQKELVITPSSVDILWEATDSATPPFYRGKALPTTQAKLKFVAIPNIKTSDGVYVNPNNIVYTWSNDYTADRNSSGYGKQSYNIDMAMIDQGESVEVKAQMRGGGFSAVNQVNTGIFDPKIIWYSTSPLYGPQFENALTNGSIVTSGDVSVFAEPYFASPRNILNGNLTYNWTLNNQSVDTPQNANEISFHRNNTNKGIMNLSLSINNTEKFLQDLSGSLSLQLE